ncbi:hypothetical protein GCM10027059_21200 [Myceligenerans halotolerans]
MTTLKTTRPARRTGSPSLQDEAVAWLQALGTDQWQDLRPHRHGTGRSLAEAIERGEVYIVRDEDRITGTITLDEYADPEFWMPGDHPHDALYVHRMVVAREARGQDTGGQMIEWARTRAAAQGKQWLRLDAWRTNAELHNYYLRHGFEHVRTVNLPHRGSGALFQQAATREERDTR